MQIAILALSLTEPYDAVCYDVIYQYKALCRILGESNVRLFAEASLADVHPGIHVGDRLEFKSWCVKSPSGLVLFHYCDGRNVFDEDLRALKQPVIVRWHNNTPPWFNIEASGQAIHSQIGYENLVQYVDSPNVTFWANSNFTMDQLVALGCNRDRVQVVYPATRFLDVPKVGAVPQQTAEDGFFDLLFVGRIVPHKGHLNAILIANVLQRLTSASVRLHLVGKRDPGMTRFNMELERRAAESPATVLLYGHVTSERLGQLYRESTAFLCVSEHEGFGLPVLEASLTGLPVVAWATSAFRELLGDHPFAYRHFDPELFAATLLSLKMPEARALAAASQARLVDSYSHDILVQQIHDAIGIHLRHVSVPRKASLRPLGAGAEPVLADVFGGYMESLSVRFAGRDKSLLHDSGANLVSLYDLEQYRRFFERKRNARFAPLSPATNRQVHIEPTEQSFRGGVLVDGRVTWAGDLPQGCIVWGPYMELAPGEYVAEFELQASSSGHNQVLKLDINATSGVLAEKVTTLSDIFTGTPVQVRFKARAARDWYEFRVTVTGYLSSDIRYAGVRLRNALTDVKELKVARPQDVAWLPATPLMAPFGTTSIGNGASPGHQGHALSYVDKIRLPPGHYHADLQIFAGDVGTGDVTVTITQGALLLSSRKLPAAGIRNYEPLLLPFHVDEGGEIAFSVNVTDSEADDISYAGMYIVSAHGAQQSSWARFLPASILRYLARRNMRLRRFVAAVGFYQALEQRLEMTASDWVQYGHALKEERQFHRAEVAYHRAIAINPDDHETRLHLAHLYNRMNRNAKAEHFFRQMAGTPFANEAERRLAALRSTSQDVERTLR